MIIYFDGGCRPNPGAMEWAIVSECGIKFHFRGKYGTNNQAEWQGFLEALVMTSELEEDIIIRGDSKLVIEQFSGRWKINNEALKSYYAVAMEYKKKHRSSLKVEWIGRKDNLAGIYIEEINK